MTQDHISWTQIDMATRCGQQWIFRYVDGLRIPPKKAMAVGTGVHAGAAARHLFRRDQDLEMPRDDVIGRAVDAYDIASAECEDKELGEGRDETARLASVFAERLAPMVTSPKEVEYEFRIPTKFDVEILGYIDLIEGDNTVSDLKTAKRSQGKMLVETSGQLTLYAIARKIETGLWPSVAIHEIVKSKKPTANIYRGTRTVEDAGPMIQRIHSVLTGMREGILPPAPIGAWWCSPEQCGYWSRCKYVRH